MRIYSFLLLFVVLFSCKSTKKINLQLDLPLKDKFMYAIHTQSEVNVNVMNMDQKTISIQNYDVEYEVSDKKENGDLAFTTTIKDVQIEQISPMFTSIYNSKEPEKNSEDGTADMYNAILGHQLQMVLSKTGKLLSINGNSEMLDKMMEKVQGNDLMSKEQFKASMESQFGDKAMAKSFGGVTQIYPSTAVKIGDTWTKSDTLDGTISLITYTTYTLTEIKEGKAYLNVNGTISPNPNAKGVDMMGMKMRYNLEGTQTGTMILDEKTGWVDDAELTQETSGTINMSGEMVGNMESAMSMTTITTYKRS